jgi:hypothetical protein
MDQLVRNIIYKLGMRVLKQNELGKVNSLYYLEKPYGANSCNCPRILLPTLDMFTTQLKGIHKLHWVVGIWF